MGYVVLNSREIESERVKCASTRARTCLCDVRERESGKEDKDVGVDDCVMDVSKSEDEDAVLKTFEEGNSVGYIYRNAIVRVSFERVGLRSVVDWVVSR